MSCTHHPISGPSTAGMQSTPYPIHSLHLNAIGGNQNRKSNQRTQSADDPLDTSVLDAQLTLLTRQTTTKMGTPESIRQKIRRRLLLLHTYSSANV